MNKEELAGIVKRRRKQLNLDIEVLALESGISLRTIRQIESGKGNPRLDTLNTLFKSLGLKMEVKQDA